MKFAIALTCDNDYHTLAVAKKSETQGLPLIILERENYGIQWLLTSVQKKTGTIIYLENKNITISNKEIGAIWNRRDFIADNRDYKSEEEKYISIQTAIHVNGIFKYLENKVPSMNKPSANAYASSKFLQNSIASRTELLIPESYFGGSPLIADEFIKSIPIEEKLSIKPLESIHLKSNDGNTYAHYNSIFKRRSSNDLKSLSECPVILQKFIDKDFELRVTVVGENIYPAEIHTANASEEAKIDWRHYDWANTPYYASNLPEYINKSLLYIMSELGLSYGAFDLIKSKSGDYFFLEVNSQGQWLWIEDLTDLAITDGIVKWLKDAIHHEN
jgi:glutathione synthase/RimK-type ligase-like ATP-grasp enzyme